jgi:hypothetical protein
MREYVKLSNMACAGNGIRLHVDHLNTKRKKEKRNWVCINKEEWYRVDYGGAWFCVIKNDSIDGKIQRKRERFYYTLGVGALFLLFSI